MGKLTSGQCVAHSNASASPTIYPSTSRFSHIKKAALESALELVWPTRCIGCDALGTLLCQTCRLELPWIARQWACPVCGAPFGWLTCTECNKDWEVSSCTSAFVYAGTAAKLICQFKDAHEGRLAPVLAAALATALDLADAHARAQRVGEVAESDAASTVLLRQSGSAPASTAAHLGVLFSSGGATAVEARDSTSTNALFSSTRAHLINLGTIDAVTFVPATQAAYRRRGFDHMEAVSKHLADMLGIPWVDALYHDRARDQRKFGKRDRAANIKGTFESACDMAGARVLLVDDVITTGASMREAARVLLARGVLEVHAACIARTW